MKYILLLAALFFFGLNADAQVKTKKAKKVHTKHKAKEHSNSAVFVCPMHATETSGKPGKCGQCGMDLKSKNFKNKGETHKHAYQCPMKCEGDKTYAEKGSCPKCKMDLTKKEG
ncbi:MAG: heavy metal-binding domain-containing protein [Ferruginibacter sp.]